VFYKGAEQVVAPAWFSHSLKSVSRCPISGKIFVNQYHATHRRDKLGPYKSGNELLEGMKGILQKCYAHQLGRHLIEIASII
jgi:hypothetical protein